MIRSTPPKFIHLTSHPHPASPSFSPPRPPNPSPITHHSSFTPHHTLAKSHPILHPFLHTSTCKRHRSQKSPAPNRTITIQNPSLQFPPPTLLTSTHPRLTSTNHLPPPPPPKKTNKHQTKPQPPLPPPKPPHRTQKKTDTTPLPISRPDIHLIRPMPTPP